MSTKEETIESVSESIVGYQSQHPAPVLNSNGQHISDDTIVDENEKRGGIRYYSQEQEESFTKIVGKYTLFVSCYVIISLF